MEQQRFRLTVFKPGSPASETMDVSASDESAARSAAERMNYKVVGVAALAPRDTRQNPVTLEELQAEVTSLRTLVEQQGSPIWNAFWGALLAIIVVTLATCMMRG